MTIKKKHDGVIKRKKEIKHDFLPGPLAPPDERRPRRKIIARWYSFTICIQRKTTPRSYIICK